MQNEKQTTESIEALILKHCPEDKRLSRWLLEIVNEILETQDPYSERGLNYSVVPKKLLQQLRAIYTGLEHCPEDKAVGKLVEALKHAISAIKSLPDNIFGMNDNGCAGPEREEWPIKDELLSELQAALSDYEANK